MTLRSSSRCRRFSVQFNSLIDVTQVAQRYATIVAHTWRRVSVQKKKKKKAKKKEKKKKASGGQYIFREPQCAGQKKENRKKHDK